jgi:Flp pilus assembly protein TadG
MTPKADKRSEARPGGQILVIFALAIMAMMGMIALVIDVSWYWTNALRVQRAADAAALAGVVWLPGQTATAYSTARLESRKNGYTDGVSGVTITTAQEPALTGRRLAVTVNASVGTYFMRLIGINSIPVTRTARAEYVLPVPMGSPQPYFGIGYYVEARSTTTSSNSTAAGNSGLKAPSISVAGGQWTNPNNAFTSNNQYATDATNLQQQQWSTFGLAPALAGNQAMIGPIGLEVKLTNANVSAVCANSQIRVEVSWDGGNSWSSPQTTANLTTAPLTVTFGVAANTTVWGPHTWTYSDFTTANFRTRLTALKGCATAGTTLQVDMLQVRASYTIQTTTTTTSTTLIQDAPVPPPPGGSAISPQKFWGAMQSQGAPNVQGDAFMTKYETRKTTLNSPGGAAPDAQYDPTNYYNYVVELPSTGAIWVFDPGFCDVSTSGGTGESWTVGAPNGNNTVQPISAYFDVLNTNGTLADIGDDTLVASSGTTFRRSSYSDTVMHGLLGSQAPTNTDCSGQSWHNGWYRLANGLPAGTYRLHTYSTDFSAPNDQDDSTGLNAFGFYATASGGTPRIYGLGAMQAYIRLPGGQASEFYLAQIEAVHAGKTLVINLWDPGDTGALSASLEILAPTGSGFTPAAFKYQGMQGTTNASVSNCNGLSSGAGTVTAVTTNTGGTSLYNGCWLTIEIALPSNYSAPNDPVSGQPGWWKIRYTMGNGGNGFSTDMTTWKVDIRGNPVHLVIP